MIEKSWELVIKKNIKVIIHIIIIITIILIVIIILIIITIIIFIKRLILIKISSSHYYSIIYIKQKIITKNNLNIVCSI